MRGVDEAGRALSRPDLCVAAALAVGVAGLFARALAGGFLVFDDNVYLVETPHVADGLSWAGLRWALTASVAGNWHPLTLLSHMLDCELYGLWAPGHHATSVGVHALCAAALYLVLVRMTGWRLRSALVVGLFAVHPLRVESVAWIAERKDVLSGLLCVLALGAWLRWLEAPSLRRYAWVAVAFALALAAKPMAVTLPVLLGVLDYWPLARAGRVPLSRRIVEKAPLLGLSLCVGLVTLWTQAGAIRSEVPLGLGVGNALLSHVAYLGKLVWPVSLAAFYPYRDDVSGAELALAASVLVTLAVAAAASWRTRPWLGVGALWFAIALAPVGGWLPVGSQAMADRYTYLPSIGLALAAVWGLAEPLARVAPALRRAAFGAAGAVLVALCALTWVQIGHWRDTRSLFEHALAVTRDNWFAHTEVAIALEYAGELEPALAHYRRAVALRPGYARAQANYGHALLAAGDAAGALASLEIAQTLDPELRGLAYALGRALEANGRPDAARAQYREALRREREHAGARQRLEALGDGAP